MIALVILGLHAAAADRRSSPRRSPIFGAAVLLLLDNLGKDSAKTQSKNVHGALSEAEWITLMFFLGLFVLVYGIQKAGLIDMMAKALLKATGGDFNGDGARDPVGVGGPVGVHRQHSVRRDDDPADQGDGPDLRRRQRAAAAVVGAVARRVPGRQRHADRRVGQPRRRRASPSAPESRSGSSSTSRSRFR